MSVDFPHPDGADRTMNSGFVFMAHILPYFPLRALGAGRLLASDSLPCRRKARRETLAESVLRTGRGFAVYGGLKPADQVVGALEHDRILEDRPEAGLGAVGHYAHFLASELL